MNETGFNKILEGKSWWPASGKAWVAQVIHHIKFTLQVFLAFKPWQGQDP